MALQISVYNLHTKQKDIRYVFKEKDDIKIIGAIKKLTNEVRNKAFDFVLIEHV